ncbi:hypothetical protein [Nocardia sp. NBC_01388]|uniref:hypothetical protein n=1 Tax=Nocardia sp. NBC_01388 TaxID=2903596 RepID=UPI0032511132
MVVKFGDTTSTATGLGAYIAEATTVGDGPRIPVGVLIMSAYVTGLNRLYHGTHAESLWPRRDKLVVSRLEYNGIDAVVPWPPGPGSLPAHRTSMRGLTCRVCKVTIIIFQAGMVFESEPMASSTPPPADTIDEPSAKRARTRLRAAKTLFAMSISFIASQIVIQLIECSLNGRGLGISDAATDGRSQELVPVAAGFFHTASNLHTVTGNVVAFFAWVGVCSAVSYGYYALLDRLGSF